MKVLAVALSSALLCLCTVSAYVTRGTEIGGCVNISSPVVCCLMKCLCWSNAVGPIQTELTYGATSTVQDPGVTTITKTIITLPSMTLFREVYHHMRATRLRQWSQSSVPPTPHLRWTPPSSFRTPRLSLRPRAMRAQQPQ